MMRCVYMSVCLSRIDNSGVHYMVIRILLVNTFCFHHNCVEDCGLAAADLLYTTLFYIVSSCPETKLDGDVQRLYLADDMAVKGLMAHGS